MGVGSRRSARLTIGLPVRNGHAFLAASLESILAQTWSDFRIVISDNASTDDTEDICRGFAARDDRIEYHRQPVNIGACPNFNFVFQDCPTEYFKWVAADDLHEPEFLELCIKELDGRPECPYAHSLTSLIDEHAVVRGTLDALTLRPGLPAHRRLRWVLWVTMLTEMFGVARTAAVKRTALHGSYPGSDRVYTAQMLLQGDRALVPACLFKRRDHPGAYSRIAGSTAEAQQFHDPKRHISGVGMRWERLTGHLRTVASAPLSMMERLACVSVILQRPVVKGYLIARGRRPRLSLRKEIGGVPVT